MYNLLVTAAEGAWDLPANEFDRTCFLEYTDKATEARFLTLGRAIDCREGSVE